MANRATETAFGPITIVAAEQRWPAKRRLVHDELAVRFLPRGLRTAVRLARWRPIERLLIKASEDLIPGIWGSMLCRKRYVDDKTRNALAAGVESVVILGAGLDDRAYRIPGLDRTPVYELDLPGNIAYKQKAVRRVLGTIPDSVHLVPVDFEDRTPADALAEHGYDPTRPTLFIWEAVTHYLTEPGVRQTMDFLARAPAGSHLVFTYALREFIDGSKLHGAQKAYDKFVVQQRLWHFGLDPDAVAPFLAEYGWAMTEQLGPAEFTERYVRPTGRSLPITPLERSVHATKVGNEVISG